MINWLEVHATSCFPKSQTLACHALYEAAPKLQTVNLEATSRPPETGVKTAHQGGTAAGPHGSEARELLRSWGLVCNPSRN